MISSFPLFQKAIGLIQECDDFANDHQLLADSLQWAAKIAFEWTICLSAAIFFPTAYTVVVIGTAALCAVACFSWLCISLLDFYNLLDDSSHDDHRNDLYTLFTSLIKSENRDFAYFRIFEAAAKIATASFPIFSIWTVVGVSFVPVISQILLFLAAACKLGIFEDVQKNYLEWIRQYQRPEKEIFTSTDEINSFFSFFFFFNRRVGKTILDEIIQRNISLEEYYEFSVEYLTYYRFVSSAIIGLFDSNFQFTDHLLGNQLTKLKIAWRQLSSADQDLLRKYFSPQGSTVEMEWEESQKVFRNQLDSFSQSVLFFEKLKGGLKASFESDVRNYVLERSYVEKISFLPPAM